MFSVKKIAAGIDPNAIVAAIRRNENRIASQSCAILAHGATNYLLEGVGAGKLHGEIKLAPCGTADDLQLSGTVMRNKYIPVSAVRDLGLFVRCACVTAAGYLAATGHGWAGLAVGALAASTAIKDFALAVYRQDFYVPSVNQALLQAALTPERGYWTVVPSPESEPALTSPSEIASA